MLWAEKYSDIRYMERQKFKVVLSGPKRHMRLPGTKHRQLIRKLIQRAPKDEVKTDAGAASGTADYIDDKMG